MRLLFAAKSKLIKTKKQKAANTNVATQEHAFAVKKRQ